MSDQRRHPLSPSWQTFWALVGVPWVLVSLLGLLHHLSPWNPRVGDLVQDWLSARCYLAGQDVYTSLDDSMPEFLGIQNSQGPESLRVNAHPPPSILLVLPLAQVDYPVAKLIWNLLSLACVALAVAGIVSRAGLALDGSNVWPFAVLVLCSGPLASQTLMLQFNGILLGMLTASWLLARHGWSWLAGALIGVAGSIKLFPLYLLFVFAMLRDWRGVAGGAISFAAMAVASAALFGTSAWHHFVSEVVPSLSIWRGAWLNSSFTGFWSRLFDPGHPHTVPLILAPHAAQAIILLSSASLTAAVAWKAWRAQSLQERDRAWGAGIVAMILCSPTAWDHYWLMLVLPLASLWWTARFTHASRMVFWTCIIGLGVVRPGWVWPLIGTGAQSQALPVHSLTILAYPFYCLLALFALLILSRSGASDDLGDSTWTRPA